MWRRITQLTLRRLAQTQQPFVEPRLLYCNASVVNTASLVSQEGGSQDARLNQTW